MKEQEADELLELLNSSSDRILIGFFEGLVKLWKASPYYDEFIQAIRTE